MANDSGAPAPVAGATSAVAPNQGTFGQESVEAKTAPVAEPVATVAAVTGPEVIGDPPAKPQETAPVLDVSKPVTYEPTGNVALDVSLAFVGKLGLGPEHAAMKAASTGDFSLLKAVLSTMGAKAVGWEANVALGEKAYADTKAATDSKSATDRKAMMDAVGGEEAWTSVKAFAAEATADAPEERAAVNKALAEGGLVGKAMAVYLKTLHDQFSNSKEPASATQPNSERGGATKSNNGALSPREYTAAVADARAKNRGDFDNSPEYKALQARRALWRDRSN